MLKKFISLILIAGLSSCSPKKSDPNTIVVGCIAGPETELMRTAAKVAHERYNLTVIIKEFSDYLEPNRALFEHDIDANMYQHEPYLKSAMHNFGYDFAIIGKTFIYPMGLYSKTVKKVDDVAEHGIVLVPSDPSNEARALLLLAKAGLISLAQNSDPFDISVNDIQKNPRKLIIKEVDAAMIPRLLPDSTLAAINSNYAVLNNLQPAQDALILEDSNSPYANILVVNKSDKDEAKYQKLLEALHSSEVAAQAKLLFKDAVISTAIPAKELLRE